jgi:hypothetical protein
MKAEPGLSSSGIAPAGWLLPGRMSSGSTWPAVSRATAEPRRWLPGTTPVWPWPGRVQSEIAKTALAQPRR